MSRVSVFALLLLLLLAACTLAQTSLTPANSSAVAQTVLPSPTSTAFPSASPWPCRPTMPCGRITPIPTPTATTSPYPELVDVSNGRTPREVARLGRGSIYNIAVSPNMEYLVATSSTGVWIYRMADGSVVLYKEGATLNDTFEVTDIAWSPDGAFLAVGNRDTRVWVWDSGTWELITEGDDVALVSGSLTSSGLGWSPDGMNLAVSSGGASVWVWNRETGIWADWSKLEGGYSGLSWLPDGKLIVLRGDGIYDVVSGEFLHPLDTWIDGCCSKLSWSPDGDQVLVLFDLGGGVINAENSEYAFWAGAFPKFAWSPGGNYFATTFSKREGPVLWIYDTETKNLVKNLALEDSIDALAWTKQGDLLAAGIQYGKTVLWNTQTGEVLFSLEEHIQLQSFWLDTSHTWDEASQLLFVAQGRYLQVWDTSSKDLVKTFRHTDQIIGLSLSPTLRHIAAIGYDRQVPVWDLESGRLLIQLSNHIDSEYIDNIQWSPSGLYLASNDSVGKVIITKINESFTQFFWPITVSNENHTWSYLNWSPIEDVLLFFSFPSTYLASDVDNSGQMSLRVLNLRYRRTTWSPDGKLVAANIDGEKLFLLGLGSSGIIATLENPLIDNEIEKIIWSPDSKYICALTRLNDIVCWRTGDATVIGLYRIGQFESVHKLSWSNRGLLALAMYRGKVIVINPINGTILASFQPHQGNILQLMWSEDGNLVYTTSTDGTFRVWEIFP